MILIRCSKCNKFYSLKYDTCKYCGHKDRSKAYYVRLDNKDEYVGNSLQVAQKKDHEKKLDKRLGKLPEYKKPNNIVLTEFINKYFEPHYQTKNKRPDSISAQLLFYKDYFKNKNLSDITQIDVENMMRYISETPSDRTGKIRSPQTRQHYLKTLRRIFNYAVECDFLVTNPMNKIPNLKFDNKITRYLTAPEEKKLLAETAKINSPYLHNMVLIALYTGMRLGEIRALKRSNIRDGKIYLTGEMTKSGQGRIIPIVNPIKHIFEGKDELDFNHDVKKSFELALKRAGITEFRFHDLRHTFASKLSQAGVDLYTIMELVGHSSIDLTQRYSHLSPEHLLKAIKTLE